MDDLENTVRDGLRRAVANKPKVAPIDVLAVIERSGTAPSSSTRRTAPRWLAAAAALALVAGLGVAAVSFSQNGRVIPAAPATPAAALTLVGTAWRATTIRGEVTTPDRSGSLPYLSFDSEAEVTNSRSCHEKMGYQLVGDELSFFTIDDLGGRCGNSSIEPQHQKFDDALLATKTARRTGDTLELLNQAGAVLAVLEAAAIRSTGPAPTTSGTPTATSTRVRIYNGSGRDFDSVVLRPKETGYLADFGALRAEDESKFVTVPYADDQAEIVAISHGKQYQFHMDAYRGEVDWKRGDYYYTLLGDGAPGGFFRFSGWSSSPRQPEPLQARVRNDSSVTFDHVSIRFVDGTRLEQDGLLPGTTTAVMNVAGAYANTYAEVTVAGKRYQFAPVDNVGESPLAAGRYVWVLTLSGAQLTMHVEADR